MLMNKLILKLKFGLGYEGTEIASFWTRQGFRQDSLEGGGAKKNVSNIFFLIFFIVKVDFSSNQLVATIAKFTF